MKYVATVLQYKHKHPEIEIALLMGNTREKVYARQPVSQFNLKLYAC